MYIGLFVDQYCRKIVKSLEFRVLKACPHSKVPKVDYAGRSAPCKFVVVAVHKGCRIWVWALTGEKL